MNFGVATASYQIEGSSFGGCGRSHWDDFADEPGRVFQGHNGSIACDHYHHYETDLNLISEAGFDAYRFSFSWPRLLPETSSSLNSDGIDFYDRLIDAMLERDLKPFATLYHWDLPQRHAQKVAGKIVILQNILQTIQISSCVILVTGLYLLRL